MLRRFVLPSLAVLTLIGLALIGYAFLEARRDPIVRTAAIGLRGWPVDASPIKAVLVSDIHVGGVVVDEERLARLVTQINGLKPDIILIAGDFVDGHGANKVEPVAAALVRELSRLSAPLGVVAVMGNHDNWTNRPLLLAVLAQAGVTVLDNQVAARGPLLIAGIGDDFSRKADIPATWRALQGKPGARVALTHSPTVMTDMPTDMPLILMGHTHCGQLRIGDLIKPSILDQVKYGCGLYREPTRSIIVTAGIGTSILPFRLGAAPDLWLLTLGPKDERQRIDQ